GPGGAAKPLIDMLHEGVLRFAPGLDATGIGGGAGPQRADHVTNLSLDHLQHRVVTERRVGPEQEEQDGETGVGDAEMRLRSVAPCVDETSAVSPADVDPVDRGARVEAAGADDEVEGELTSVGESQAVAGEPLDAFGHQRAVWPL